MKNWVILFVKTGSEEKLTRLLKEALSADDYMPFLPVKETPYRNKGVISRGRKVLFPGYIFIQTEIEADSIAEELNSALIAAGLEGIYAMLHYGNNRKSVAMREKERLYWERLFDEDFCIVGSVGIIVGDRVRVMSGPLVGVESRIKKIDRHKREAVVEMEIMGALRDVRLMLEVVSKVK